MMVESVDRTILYRSTEGGRIEHARVRLSAAGGVADGTIIGMFDGAPLRVRHELTCDSRWHVRNVSVELVSAGRALLSLSADEGGIWRRVDGGLLGVPIFNCFDVALALTPIPATLTIRRLGLQAREAAIVSVADIVMPNLDVRLIEHRYTCLDLAGDRARYRFENFDTGERALISVDADGIVARHEGAFERIWPAAS